MQDDLRAYQRLARLLAGASRNCEAISRAYYAAGPRVLTHLIVWHDSTAADDGVIEVRYYNGAQIDQVLVFRARDVARETMGRGIQFDWLDLAGNMTRRLRRRLRAERQAVAS